jgi:arylsulfatase A-like enzyme
MPHERLALLIILDGLRRDAVSPSRTPNLWRLTKRGTCFGVYRSMFPSATSAVSASAATGCIPARHGLLGNSFALLDGQGRLQAHDAGLPSFLDARRALRGRALDVPTLAERLALDGGAFLCSNASPGAALAHDPERSGWLLHRAVAHAPHREIAPPEAITSSIAGDALLTARFIAEAVLPNGRRPAFGLLWLGEPDATQHAHPPGSPEAWAAVTAADARLGEVLEAVERRRRTGDEVLILAGSGHGHETVEGVIDVDAELEAAGLRPGAEHGLVALSNGTAVLVHMTPQRDAAPVLAFLRSRPWAGRVLEGESLRAFGQRQGTEGLVCAVAMRRRDTFNAFGLPGLVLAANGALGCGQHGGLGAAEQAPVLIAEGPGFAADALDPAPASPIDLAPSALAFLGRGLGGSAMDGAALQGRPALRAVA